MTIDKATRMPTTNMMFSLVERFFLADRFLAMSGTSERKERADNAGIVGEALPAAQALGGAGRP